MALDDVIVVSMGFAVVRDISSSSLTSAVDRSFFVDGSLTSSSVSADAASTNCDNAPISLKDILLWFSDGVMVDQNKRRWQFDEVVLFSVLISVYTENYFIEVTPGFFRII